MNQLRMSEADFAKHQKRIKGAIAGVVDELKVPPNKVSKTEVEIYLDIATLSESNKHEHWRAKAQRVRLHRAQAKFEVGDLLMLQMPLTVTLTRLSPRVLDDDNLRGALKAVRDGIADRLAINDNDPRVKWEYAQRRGKKGERAVEVKAVGA